jgi:hypothetical protein
MNPLRLAIPGTVLALLLCPALAQLSRADSQDDTVERIRLLEIQIQQLKELRERQKLAEGKEQQCLRPVGDAKLCACIAEALPQEVSFEQYVHFLATPKEGLNYDAMPPESRKAVDAAMAARDKCVGKGWFK